jgi:hypothetical protein
MKTFAELDSQDTITLEDMNCFADGILDQEKKGRVYYKTFLW